MAQIVKAHLFAVCPFQYLLEPLADIAGVDGLVRLDAGRDCLAPSIASVTVPSRISPTMTGGRMIVRNAAFVFGSLMIFLPPTGVTCLLIWSSPVSKFRSSHVSASISPRRSPVVSSSRKSSYIPSALV